jgi:hypothetical protein
LAWWMTWKDEGIIDILLLLRELPEMVIDLKPPALIAEFLVVHNEEEIDASLLSPQPLMVLKVLLVRPVDSTRNILLYFRTTELVFTLRLNRFMDDNYLAAFTVQSFLWIADCCTMYSI